jgi:hypothetical protein
MSNIYSDFGYKGSYGSPQPMGGMFGLNLDFDSENLKNINSINVFKDAGRIVYILKDFTNICRLIWK